MRRFKGARSNSTSLREQEAIGIYFKGAGSRQGFKGVIQSSWVHQKIMGAKKCPWVEISCHYIIYKKNC